VLDGPPPAATARAVPSSGTFKMTKDGPVLVSSSHVAPPAANTVGGMPTGGTIRRPTTPATDHSHSHGHMHHSSIDHSLPNSGVAAAAVTPPPYRPESGRWDAAKLAAAKREAKTHAAAIAATAALTQTEWVERQLTLRSQEFTDAKPITLYATHHNDSFYILAFSLTFLLML
jgi:hypothetical protein